MKPAFWLSAVLLLVGLVPSVGAQAIEPFSYTCQNGTVIENAVRAIVNYRTGQYTTTVIGIGDFNPRLAIVDQQERELSCVDDSAAFDYTLDLPTTGTVNSSPNSVRTTFTVSGQNFLDVYFYVDNANGTGGEFLILFEELRYTVTDRIGDNVFISYTEQVAASPVPLTVYLFHVDESLDPILYTVTRVNKPITLDGELIACDDAGTLACYGAGREQSLFELTQQVTTTVVGNDGDAMLTLPHDIAEQVLTRAGNVKYVLGGYERDSEGQYLAIVHVGVADP